MSIDHRGTAGLLGVSLIAITVAFVIGPDAKVAAAALSTDTTAHLNLSWTVGASTPAEFHGGPHNWAGPMNDVHHPWNSVDFAPTDAKVLADRGGIAYRNDCGTTPDQQGFVRIDHLDGYQTTYLHLDPNNIQIQQGQRVARGQYLGSIDMNTSDHPCKSYSSGPHVHISLWYLPGGQFNFSDAQGVDLGGWSPTAVPNPYQVQIGQWAFDDAGGSTIPPTDQYNGCMTRVLDSLKVCPPSGPPYPTIINYGTMASCSGNLPIANHASAVSAYLDPNVFVRGADGSLWHKKWDGTQGFTDCFGGGIQGGPAAVSFNGATYLIVHSDDNDNTQWAKWDGSSSCCTAWDDQTHNLGGVATTDPVPVLFNNPNQHVNQLHIFIRGQDGGVYDDYDSTSDNWIGWHVLDQGGNIVGKPAVAYYNNVLYVVVRAPDNTLWWDYEWWNGIGFSTYQWHRLPPGGSATGDPALTVYNGILQLAIKGADSPSHLWLNTYDPSRYTWGTWSSPAGGPSGVVGNPTTLVWPNSWPYYSRFDVLVRGSDAAAWDYAGSWYDIGTPSTGGITNDPVGGLISGDMHVFVRGPDAVPELWDAVNTGAVPSWCITGGPWSWCDFGGRIT